MNSWTRYTTTGKIGDKRPTDSVELGPGEVAGLDRRLIGEFNGQRILELGTGSGHSAIAMARGGARVVAIGPDPGQIEQAKTNTDAAEVHVEYHSADLADLAFLAADVFDAVVSVHALASVSDLGRVFRQVHRLLKPERPLVITLPHPASLMVDPAEPNTITSSYDADSSIGSGEYLTQRHTISHVFTTLTRSNFRVDTLLEPKGADPHPASVIFRARKLGT